VDEARLVIDGVPHLFELIGKGLRPAQLHGLVELPVRRDLTLCQEPEHFIVLQRFITLSERRWHRRDSDTIFFVAVGFRHIVGVAPSRRFFA
jgi:hypothetical protein